MKTWDALYQFWKTEDGQIYSQHMGLLIRCKDCHWYSNGTLNGKHLCMINKYLFDEVEADDYCSRAERKEDGTI